MNIGFIGLGLMGTPMAKRIQDAGHRLAVYNRSKKKASSFIDKGASWCESPAEVASKSEVVCSMVSSPDVLEKLAAGKNGIIEGMDAGCVHVDFSTVSPDLTKKLHEQYRKKESYFLHSPVLGSVPNAAEGSLLLICGRGRRGISQGRGHSQAVWEQNLEI